MDDWANGMAWLVILVFLINVVFLIILIGAVIFIRRLKIKKNIKTKSTSNLSLVFVAGSIVYFASYLLDSEIGQFMRRVIPLFAILTFILIELQGLFFNKR